MADDVVAMPVEEIAALKRAKKREFQDALATVCEDLHLRKFQGSLLQGFGHIFLHQRSTLCVSPTASGKSFLYMLFPFLQKHLARPKYRVLLVSPLLTLVADQLKRMRALGLVAFHWENDTLIPLEWDIALTTVEHLQSTFERLLAKRREDGSGDDGEISSRACSCVRAGCV